jgi:dinuclear metal center YbgI/SA1388 family protein
MARRDDILAYADELLDVRSFPEFGPAGAQVLGAEEVTRIVCGVSSSRELFERASAAGAELVLVHHGLFWRNEPLVVDRRLRGRLETLFAGEITLAAYHIALDAHPEYGNNVLLARELGIEPEQRFAGIGYGGSLREPVELAPFVERVRSVTGRDPLVFPYGPARIERGAVCTGAGGYELHQAAREGYHAYVTGEAEEPNLHAAQELGIHLVAAGHYATERLGVQALAAHLAQRFGLEWEFVELPNPV